MIEPDLRRRFFAEEIEAVARLRSASLVNPLAAVPREEFLPPGPWTVVAEGDLGPGARILHVGCATGSYTALMAHCAGPSGRVLAYEADAALAADARRNLASMPWVEIRDDAAAQPSGESFDAILVNAGVTHPLDAWLDALAPAGRLILPMTSAMAPMGNIGKGLVFLMTRAEEHRFDARVTNVVAIYSAVGIRREDLNAPLGKAMMGGPQRWSGVTTLRRDPHEVSPSCWLHDQSFCLSAGGGTP